MNKLPSPPTTSILLYLLESPRGHRYGLVVQDDRFDLLGPLTNSDGSYFGSSSDDTSLLPDILSVDQFLDMVPRDGTFYTGSLSNSLNPIGAYVGQNGLFRRIPLERNNFLCDLWG